MAGLNYAHTTDSGAWTCTLDLPAMYEAGDGYPFRCTLEATSKKKVVQELGNICMQVCMCVCACMLYVCIGAGFPYVFYFFIC